MRKKDCFKDKLLKFQIQRMNQKIKFNNMNKRFMN